MSHNLYLLFHKQFCVGNLSQDVSPSLFDAWPRNLSQLNMEPKIPRMGVRPEHEVKCVSDNQYGRPCREQRVHLSRISFFLSQSVIVPWVMSSKCIFGFLARGFIFLCQASVIKLSREDTTSKQSPGNLLRN